MILTKEYLANYKYLKSMIKSIERRLKYYENHPLTSSHGVVNGSMQSFPYAACHFVVSGASVKSSEEREKTINQLMIDLEGNKRLFEDMKLDIETFIFDNPRLSIEEQTILRLKYIENRSLEEIGKELWYDKSVIARKIDSALDRLNNSCDVSEISSSISPTATKTTL